MEIEICEKCNNQKAVNDQVITFICTHIMLKHMKILFNNSRANYISHSGKKIVKEIIELYGLDIDPIPTRNHGQL